MKAPAETIGSFAPRRTRPSHLAEPDLSTSVDYIFFAYGRSYDRPFSCLLDGKSDFIDSPVAGLTYEAPTNQGVTEQSGAANLRHLDPI